MSYIAEFLKFKLFQTERWKFTLFQTSVSDFLGYFRARIKTLSEFDKVVGGLCWCITSNGEFVDVDILF